jgi:hypothetical protein
MLGMSTPLPLLNLLTELYATRNSQRGRVFKELKEAFPEKYGKAEYYVAQNALRDVQKAFAQKYAPASDKMCVALKPEILKLIAAQPAEIQAPLATAFFKYSDIKQTELEIYLNRHSYSIDMLPSIFFTFNQWPDAMHGVSSESLKEILSGLNPQLQEKVLYFIAQKIEGYQDFVIPFMQKITFELRALTEGPDVVISRVNLLFMRMVDLTQEGQKFQCSLVGVVPKKLGLTLLEPYLYAFFAFVNKTSPGHQERVDFAVNMLMFEAPCAALFSKVATILAVLWKALRSDEQDHQPFEKFERLFRSCRRLGVLWPAAYRSYISLDWENKSEESLNHLDTMCRVFSDGKLSHKELHVLFNCLPEEVLVDTEALVGFGEKCQQDLARIRYLIKVIRCFSASPQPFALNQWEFLNHLVFCIEEQKMEVVLRQASRLFKACNFLDMDLFNVVVAYVNRDSSEEYIQFVLPFLGLRSNAFVKGKILVSLTRAWTELEPKNHQSYLDALQIVAPHFDHDSVDIYFSLIRKAPAICWRMIALTTREFYCTSDKAEYALTFCNKVIASGDVLLLKTILAAMEMREINTPGLAQELDDVNRQLLGLVRSVVSIGCKALEDTRDFGLKLLCHMDLVRMHANDKERYFRILPKITPFTDTSQLQMFLDHISEMREEDIDTSYIAMEDYFERCPGDSYQDRHRFKVFRAVDNLRRSGEQERLEIMQQWKGCLSERVSADSLELLSDLDPHSYEICKRNSFFSQEVLERAGEHYAALLQGAAFVPPNYFERWIEYVASQPEDASVNCRDFFASIEGLGRIAAKFWVEGKIYVIASRKNAIHFFLMMKRYLIPLFGDQPSEDEQFALEQLNVFEGYALSEERRKDNPYHLHEYLLSSTRPDLNDVLKQGSVPRARVHIENVAKMSDFASVVVPENEIPYLSLVKQVESFVDYQQKMNWKQQAAFQGALRVMPGRPSVAMMVENLLHHPYLGGIQDEVTHERVLFHEVMQHLFSLSDIPEVGEVISPRGEFLLEMGNILENCGATKSDGLLMIWRLLPSSQIVDPGTSKARYAQNMMLKAIHALFEKTLSDPQWILGQNEVENKEQAQWQIVHYIQYLKNYLGRYLGLNVQISFEPYLHILDMTFLEAPESEWLIRLLQKLKLPDFYDQLKDQVHAHLGSMDDKAKGSFFQGVQDLIGEKHDFWDEENPVLPSLGGIVALCRKFSWINETGGFRKSVV